LKILCLDCLKEVVEEISNTEIAYENPSCEEYSFEIVIRKTGSTEMGNLLKEKKEVETEELKKSLVEKDNRIRGLEQTINHIYNSHAWKALPIYYKVRDKIFPVGSKRRRVAKFLWNSLNNLNTQNVRKSLFYIRRYGFSVFLRKATEKIKKGKRVTIGDVDYENAYDAWIKKNEPIEKELDVQRKTKFSYDPTISIIVPTLNTPEQFLRDMIGSVLNQTYSKWELCIADGGSKNNQIKQTLEEYTRQDKRIKVKFLDKNKGIAANSNEALALASGDFVALLDHDDMLPPFALYEVVKTINENRDTDFLYSDEDKISEDSKKRYDAHFKPDWAPDTMNSCNYICHLSVIKKNIVDEIGGFRDGFEGSQDYDLFLRASTTAKCIAHIPKILYHWRSHSTSAADPRVVKIYAMASGKKALSQHLSNNYFKTEVADAFAFYTYRVSYKIKSCPTVSIIIPTKDNILFVKRCLSSILERTNYPNYKILVVDNSSEEIETFKYYEEMKRNAKVSLIAYDRPFNFSAINNYAVSQVISDYILFLNNDTEVINRDWLTSMLEYAQRKEVGAVGAKLYYPDGTIQHAGVILGMGRVAGHCHRFFSKDSFGYFARLKIIQNMSAVTAACMMMRKEIFEEVGGFDESFSHAFNDIDLCMKIRQKGYLIVWTPYAELCHHESKSRGYEDTPEKQQRFGKEIEFFQKKWGDMLAKGDPYYNPNLTLDKEDFSIRI